MPVTGNVNTDHKDSYTYKRGTRQRTLAVPEDFNSIDVVKTTITTTATQINFPENANYVTLRHHSTTPIFIGGNSSVTTSNGQQVNENDVVEITVKAGNSNEIYGIVSTGTVVITATGAENK